ncbi:hypothetical protein jhhlp_005453 [Lomentospora prolificans]|uniref:Aminoglycoside phosphotransferase domain-containing protein n=1 Tax=Lomentospora prolificans TaxID=41688 RepID=A0A2N3N6Z5_9PEZI|nr:hypothetical protein jhhlp_005453 [Lomentospora prolificans]
MNSPQADSVPSMAEEAAKDDWDYIKRQSEAIETEALHTYLWEQRHLIEALVLHHLGLAPDSASSSVLPQAEWLCGRFNICVPVKVTSHTAVEKVIVRFAMRHKFAEDHCLGFMNEKISCEVATYIWMQENCPSVPIPHLFGFGFTDGRHFTHSKHRPFFVRLVRSAWRQLYKCLRWPVLSSYVSHAFPHQFEMGYLILEFIDQDSGRMLSQVWKDGCSDENKMKNLFRSLSRLILSVGRIPQPRIGSFTFNSDGAITLTNRPLTCSMAIMEAQGAQRVLERHQTYSCTDAFVSDLLSLHDSRFLNQRNAVHGYRDCRAQMATKSVLRAVQHHYINRKTRYGPYSLQFTDIHQSNILVDEGYNIKCLIDLEWICSLPTEMLAVPSWLTGCCIQQLYGEKLGEFDEIHKEFMDILSEEEKALGTFLPGTAGPQPISHYIRTNWTSKMVWFWYCLDSVNIMYEVAEDHIYPEFSLDPQSKELENHFFRLWCRGAESVVQTKVKDREAYLKSLAAMFRITPSA